MATQANMIQTSSLATWHAPFPPVMANWEDALWEFVKLLGANPHVLAVVADGADSRDSEVEVWTYLHSRNRADRSVIYAAEAEILLRHPASFFDFNVVLRPDGLTEGDLNGTVFYTKSDYGDANGSSNQSSA